MHASNHQSLGCAMDDWLLVVISYATLAVAAGSIFAGAWTILRK
jgi:hypothetical protein